MDITCTVELWSFPLFVIYQTQVHMDYVVLWSSWYICFSLGKLHFTILNYALYYTLHLKLSDCTFCTLNYHTYHTLHPGIIFVVIFNRFMLHVTSTCFLLRWKKSEKTKTPFILSSSLFLKFSFVVWEYDSENQRKLDCFYDWILIFWNMDLKFSDHKWTTWF